MTTIKASHKLHQTISHHDIQLVLIFAITSHYDHHKDHHEISIFILFISISMMMSLTSLMASTFTIDIQQLQPRLSTKMKKRPMSQPKALIDEELTGTTGLVALKISLCVWWHWTWLINMADCPAMYLIFTFSDSKTCLKPSNAKCVNWFWSVYPKSILSPIASDLKFCCWCPEWLILEKSREKFCIDKCVIERKRRWFRTLIHPTKKHHKISPNSPSVEINELSVLCPEEFAIVRHNFSSSYAF